MDDNTSNEIIKCANMQLGEQYNLIYCQLYSKLEPALQNYCTTHNVFPMELLTMINNNTFHMIPFHYGFKINKQGIVVDLKKQIVITPTLNKLGYYIVTVRPDNKSKSVSSYLHRLLAFTFITPFTWDVNKRIQVNHIDGNKLNNDLSNLEWVTQQNNCIHAFMTGLRPDNNRMLLTNDNTGKQTEYHSQAAVASKLGISPSTLCTQLKSIIANNSSYKGYKIQYA